MALRFCDSFDHYSDAQLTKKWTTGPSASAITTAGRHGNGFSSNTLLVKTLDPQSVWTAGFAIKGLSLANVSSIYRLQALNITGVLLTFVEVVFNNDSTFSLRIGGNVVAVTPPYDISGFHFVECATTLTGTATITASSTIRINTETVAVGAGSVGHAVSEIASGGAKANVHAFSAFFGGTIDDLYITDGNGSVNTGYLGDVKIQCIYPNGDNTVQWTAVGSSTATHYVNINEHSPDGDTSYVYSTATGSMELFDWEDIASFSGTIKGVQYSVYARKDEEGARVINLLEGTTGTNTLTNAVTSKADLYLNDDYDYHHLALDTSPTTGTGWTVAGFNADRFGFRVGTNT